MSKVVHPDTAFFCAPRGGAGESSHNAVQGAQFLLGALGALKQACAGLRTMLGRASRLRRESRSFSSSLLEMVEEVEELFFGRRPAPAAAQDFGSSDRTRGEPLIADDQHCLGEIERGEGGG